MACLNIWDSAPFLICFHCVYFKLVAHFQSNFNSCSLNSEYFLQNTQRSHDDDDIRMNSTLSIFRNPLPHDPPISDTDYTRTSDSYQYSCRYTGYVVGIPSKGYFSFATKPSFRGGGFFCLENNRFFCLETTCYCSTFL